MSPFLLLTGNNAVPFVCWTQRAMQLILQSPKHRLCFDPHQFCPYCQMFAVSLFTEFADLSFFCSVSPAPSLLQCWGSTASNGVSSPFQTVTPSFKAGTIHFHIFQPVILLLGVSLGPIPTVSQGCMFTKFKVPLLTSTLRRWPRPHLTSPLNLFLSRYHPHPPFSPHSISGSGDISLQVLLLSSGAESIQYSSPEPKPYFIFDG